MRVGIYGELNSNNSFYGVKVNKIVKGLQ